MRRFNPQQDDTADDQRNRYRHRREQHRLDVFFEQQACHDGRKARDDHVDYKTARRRLGSQPQNHTDNACAVFPAYREDCAKLDRNVEDLAAITSEIDQFAHQDQVSCTGYGKKFGQPFHQAEHQRLEQQQQIHPIVLRRSSRGRGRHRAQRLLLDYPHAYAIRKNCNCTGFVLLPGKLQLFRTERMNRIVSEQPRHGDRCGGIDLLRVRRRIAANVDPLDIGIAQHDRAARRVIREFAGQAHDTVHQTPEERTGQMGIDRDHDAVGVSTQRDDGMGQRQVEPWADAALIGKLAFHRAPHLPLRERVMVGNERENARLSDTRRTPSGLPGGTMPRSSIISMFIFVDSDRQDTMNIEQARFNMIEQQIRPWEVLDQDVLNLLAIVKRERFVPHAYRNIAFADLEVPLPAGQQMLSPKIEARVLQELAVKKHETVLEIGAGSGYMAALLAHRARSVLTLDIIPELVDLARANLAANGVTNVQVETGDGARGWPAQASYDVICLSGGLPVLPQEILEQLKIGGRLAAFVGVAPVMRAQIITRVDATQYRIADLFETFVNALVNALEPPYFKF
ncbi:hypothetical protein DFQ28_008020 [Apophysomyces sp. BC1034]|nr:hypothetical protein DFQ30_010167 [Apophysomyces sp. BC1015]KAG0186333.1 hypothetical protein DFQ28_008020 [Apophysomyces sp. BC1034]